jgi:hypothetical protein
VAGIPGPDAAQSGSHADRKWSSVEVVADTTTVMTGRWARRWLLAVVAVVGSMAGLTAAGSAGAETTTTTAPAAEAGVEVDIVLSGDCAPENGAELLVINHLAEPVDVHVAGGVVGTVSGGSAQRFVVDLLGPVEITATGGPVAFDETAVCPVVTAPAPADATTAATTPERPLTAAPTFTG